MRKKRVSADVIVAMIELELRASDATATPHPPIGIVPDAIHGWTALLRPRDRARYPDEVRAVERIQATLRKQYSLIS